MKTLRLIFFLSVLSLPFPPRAAALDADVRALIVGIAPDWNSMKGRLQCFRRGPDGKWLAAAEPVPVLFGKNGLAWGSGVHGGSETGLHKRERDGRAPAGVFKIGTIYTYDSALPAGASYPFHTVTKADAWVDNPKSPDYNKFITIADPKNPPAWFEKAKMRHGDFAYRWLVEIRHNSDPPVAGEGSAIFFHIRRGVSRPTSGCTTMAESDLVKLIQFLRAADNPHYALLPWPEYGQRWRSWGLPDPSLIAAKP